jgi:membrane protein
VSQRARLEAALTWFRGTLAGECAERTIELRPLERALALSSKAFVAIIPFAMVSASISPASRRGGFAEGVIDRFDLEGTSADAVRRLFATPEEVQGGVTAVGVIVLLASVFSLARSLGRLYEEAWHLPPLRGAELWRGLVWVLVMGGWVAFVLPLRDALVDATGSVLSTLVILATGTLLWLLTPYLLLAGRVRRPRLLTTGLVTAALLLLYSAASEIYLPRTLETSAERYGLVGVAFALLSWLVGFFLAIIVGAAIGAVAGEKGTRAAPTSRQPGR